MMVQFDVKRVQKGTESFMVSFDFTKTPVTQIADYIIMAASHYGTSDIHFDPREEGMMVRFRIDGDCQDYTFIPKAYEKNLTTRLKIMANMNITESRLPQDGAIKGTFGDTYLDMRVSALPLNEGEKIVIRILDYSRSLEGIDTLGFHPKNLEKIKRMMNLPNGIILTTGATGSGKSTTTYSILQGLNKPETNVITVEDPIEMNIEGINQVQVNAEIGMTFAAALRSILRQDPNVILIGEIRDSETAQIAVRASITGHLVLSTIHTNNALATVERLLDMNVERYLLSTAMAGIISQRLAKMLCPDCRYQRETTKYEKKVFKKYMNMDVKTVWDANPKGCDHCRKGYHGRIAFHEVLEIDESVRSALSNEKLTKKELAKMVYSGSTITMLQDALIKCLEGQTSFEEVYRNIEIENEDDDNYENEMATEIKETIPVDEEVQVSDDLLETPITKKEESTVIMPPSFKPEDFQENTSETTENTDNNTNVESTDVVQTNATATQENTSEVQPNSEITQQSTSGSSTSSDSTQQSTDINSNSAIPGLSIPTISSNNDNNSNESENNTNETPASSILNLPSLGSDDGEEEKTSEDTPSSGTVLSIPTFTNTASATSNEVNNSQQPETLSTVPIDTTTSNDIVPAPITQEQPQIQPQLETQSQVYSPGVGDSGQIQTNAVDAQTNSNISTTSVAPVQTDSNNTASTTNTTNNSSGISENPLGPITPISLPAADVSVVPGAVEQLSTSPFMNQEVELPPSSAPTLPAAETGGESIDISAPNPNPLDNSTPLVPTIS